MSHAENSSCETESAPPGVGLHALVLPRFLEDLDDEWFIPTWRTMDGNEPRVYAVDIEASIRANRPLLEHAY